MLKNYDKDDVILNLGSGISFIHRRDDVINIDISDFKNVDVVANVYDLTFQDNCVDLILNIGMLEHAKNPQKIIDEMYRVLAP
ncbi:MAG: class I SAM-dependent methyltransferase [Actinobacteria bacterium]|nr:class I SAM-dependent methyltransferase [Actinomycetota bacterium]MBM3712545.1 class I SAM-dependent methyltransferase [Actinomycetota bacterium]